MNDEEKDLLTRIRLRRIKDGLPVLPHERYRKLIEENDEENKTDLIVETVGRVLSVTTDEHGVTAQIRLAPGWTVEKIEEKLRHFFWGGPDDYDFNEFVVGETPRFPTPGPLRLKETYPHEDTRTSDRLE